MPNHFYTYILDIYDLVWLSFMAYQPLQTYLMPDPLYIYICVCVCLCVRYMIYKHVLSITFLNELELTQLNDFTYFYPI